MCGVCLHQTRALFIATGGEDVVVEGVPIETKDLDGKCGNKKAFRLMRKEVCTVCPRRTRAVYVAAGGEDVAVKAVTIEVDYQEEARNNFGERQQSGEGARWCGCAILNSIH